MRMALRTRERCWSSGRIAVTFAAILGAAGLAGCTQTELDGGVATAPYQPYAESYGAVGPGYAPWYGPSYVPYSSFGFGFFGGDEFRHHHFRHHEEERHRHVPPPVASATRTPHSVPVPHAAPMPHVALPRPAPQSNAAAAAHNRQLLKQLGVR